MSIIQSSFIWNNLKISIIHNHNTDVSEHNKARKLFQNNLLTGF